MSCISRLLAGLLLLGVLAGCDDGAAATGTIKISVQGWSGVDGYRLLAGVWDDSLGARDLVGGAFWTMVDSDPFSAEDVVHPPHRGDDEPDDGDGWGAGDYVWDETARLEPGTYLIDLWANPGELAPYGSHLPASPIERGCSVEVEVAAGETTTVVISDTPSREGIGGWQQDLCPADVWTTY